MLLFFMLPKLGVMAAEEMTEITIEEADIKMELPASCYLLKQQIAEDDPYLQKVGADREKIQNYYKEAGIILNAIAEDDSYEIVVTMNENDKVGYIYDMQSLTEEQIREFADTIQETYASYGYTVESYELYETSAASYVVFSFGQVYEEKKIQCRQYYTIRDSRIYNITLRSYSGEVTSALEQMIVQVVDSIAFTEDTQEATYKNDNIGVSFSLDNSWKRLTTNQDNKYTQAQYMHTMEDGEGIQFFSMDLWGSMDALHQLRNTRDELTMKEGMTDRDKKTYEAYVNGFFDDYKAVSFEKKGNTWYLTSDTPTQANSEGYLQKSAVTVQNGILYAFRYGYYEESNFHERDFEELLAKVSYHSPKLLAEDGPYYERMQGMLNKMTAVVVLVVLMLAGVCYIYMKETKK